MANRRRWRVRGVQHGSGPSALAVLGAVALAVAAAACERTRANPDYCLTSETCGEGKICDETKHLCVPASSADAGTGGRGTGGQGVGGAGGNAGRDGSVGTGGSNTGGAPAGDASTGGSTGTGGMGTPPDGGADRPGDAAVDMVMTCPPCPAATPICDTKSWKCVGCLMSSQCTTTPGKSICDTTTNTCVGCVQSDQCPTEKPVCDTAATAKVCVGCLQNNQCPTEKPVCDTAATKSCVGCLQSSQCTTATKPICGATKTCGACMADTECAMARSTTPVCLASGACAECKANTDCATKTGTPACSAEGKCVQCTVDNDCSDTKPICNKMTNTCVACANDAQCQAKNPATPGCMMTAGATQGSCVACTTHAHCDKAANKPVCVANVCSACTADRQCVDKAGADPGVCMSHTDGHCATATEVLYVKPITGCSDTGTGTATVPFCTVPAALGAVTATKNVVVVRKGPLPLVNWSFAGTSPVSVIGQGGASVGPGAGVGISITSGEVFIRNLGVSGMSDLGVSVAAGATLKMDGCIVTANYGGLAVNGGGFEINNSVFAENMGATAPAAFGGVYLKSGASMPAQFRNNTIYANAGPGLVCDGTYPVRGLLVGNNTVGQVTGCNFADGSSFVGTMMAPPNFDPARPYHLTAQSLLCVDVGNTTDFSPHDLDGNPRPSPAGGRSDCGAHELQK